MANSKKNAGTSKSASIVYTEDGVPVYTLYLGNVPQSKTEDEIKKHFSTYGEVSTVAIIRKSGNASSRGNSFQYGFVTFAKPEFAAMALKQPNHRVISKRIKVRAADTWKQPAAAHKAKSNKEAADNAEMGTSEEGVVSILGLNDDCLMHIFSFLGQIERLKLSFVCQRFYNIVEHWIKVNKQFDFNGLGQSFTLMQMRQILSSFGTHIQRLHLRGVNETYRRYLEFIAIYCRNLLEVNFELFRNIHFETYSRIFLASKQLQSLILEDCDIDNRVCNLFGQLTELKSLNLAHNCDITGRYLKNLKSITKLNLSNCENIETTHFIDICKSLQLKVLNIVGCYQLSDEAFLTLVKTQTGLEEIMISDSYHSCRVDLVGQLSSLKHIRIHREGGAYFGTDILREIVTNRMETLESLEIYNLLVTVEERNRDQLLLLRNLRKLCLVRDKHLDNNYLEQLSKNCKLLERVNIAGSVLISETGILDLVQNLKHLKFLNISYCEQFKNGLVHQIYNVLEELGDGGREAPLTLCVNDTGIEKAFLNSEEYRKYKRLLVLTFDTDAFCIENYDDIDFLSDESFNDVFDYFNDYVDSDDSYGYDMDDFFYDSDDMIHPDAIYWL